MNEEPPQTIEMAALPPKSKKNEATPGMNFENFKSEVLEDKPKHINNFFTNFFNR